MRAMSAWRKDQATPGKERKQKKEVSWDYPALPKPKGGFSAGLHHEMLRSLSRETTVRVRRNDECLQS